MGLLSRMRQAFKYAKQYKDNPYNTISNPTFRNVLKDMNSNQREREELEWYAWYRGTSNDLIYYYQVLAPLMKDSEIDFKYEPPYTNYFWYANREDVKKTHSGLAKEICETIVSVVGQPTKILVEEQPALTDRLVEINEANNFKEFLREQISEMVGLGNVALFVDIVKGIDYPVYSIASGVDVDFEWLGNLVVAISRRQHYSYKGNEYQLIEKRGLKEGHATIEYKLFQINGNEVKEVPLKTIPDLANLVNLEFPNTNFLLAVPFIWDFDKAKGRGRSIYANKLDLFDDYDQNLSQESNIMRAMTPVERVDINSLEVDKNGNRIKPDVFGKRFIYYHSPDSINSEVEPPSTDFQQADFSSLSTESVETLMRCLSGIISPATLGYDVARNSTDLAQREKEKVTMKTATKVIEIEERGLPMFFRLVLTCDALMRDKTAKSVNETYTINFPDYSVNTFESKLTYLTPALAQRGISPERFVTELWGDSLNAEDKKKEIEYIEKSLNPIDDISDLLGNG